MGMLWCSADVSFGLRCVFRSLSRIVVALTAACGFRELRLSRVIRWALAHGVLDSRILVAVVIYPFRSLGHGIPHYGGFPDIVGSFGVCSNVARCQRPL